MKRCPSCTFPNKDTDKSCFKCNTLLDPYTHVVSSPDISLSEVPTDNELLSQPTTEVPPLLSPEPKLLKAARILPKYKSFHSIKMLLIVIGCLQTLSMLTVGISILLYIQAYIGLTVFINTAIISSLIIIISCIIACTLLAFSFLSWANDMECNQRKHLELLNHLYHK